MEEKTAENAVDIIYRLPLLLEQINEELKALKAKNAMLESKLTLVLQQIISEQKLPEQPLVKPVTAKVVDSSTEIAKEPESEVMQAKVTVSKPVSIGATGDVPASVSAAVLYSSPTASIGGSGVISPVVSTGKTVSQLLQSNEPTQDFQESFVSLPAKKTESISIETKKIIPTTEKRITATCVKGKMKERDGAGSSGVEVKIHDSNGTMIKKTKTSGQGEWLAFLQPGEYTVEFTKSGQLKPMYKTVSVLEGQKELEVIV